MAQVRRKALSVGVAVVLGLVGAACQPQTVQVEVTRPVEVVVTQPVEVVVTSVVEVTAAPTTAPSGPSVLRVGAQLDQYIQDEDTGEATVAMSWANTGVFENLTRMDENFQLQPWLATEWAYDSGRGVWTFELRDDVFFHDGEQLTAQHVADLLNLKGSGVGEGFLLLGPEGAAAVSEFTVEVHTANLQLPWNLAHFSYGIRKGDPFAGEHIGTGPFVFEEYVANQHVFVNRNPNYWGEPAGVDRMETYFIPDPITRMLALQSGEVDIIYSPPREALAALQGRPDIQLFDTVPAKYQQLDLVVTGDPPYDILRDPLVREALGYAINRQEIIDAGWGGFAVDSQTLVAEAMMGNHASLILGYTYDPDRAAELLAEAGWADADGDGVLDKGGRRLALRMVNGWPSALENGSTPELLQAQFAAVGIELEIVPVSDFPTLAAYLTPKEADIFLEIWTNTIPTPCQIPRTGWYAGEAPNIWQLVMSPVFAGYPEINEEIDNCSASTTSDDASRWASEALHTVFDEARTAIGIVGLYETWAASDRVAAFIPHPVQGYVRWEAVRMAP